MKPSAKLLPSMGCWLLEYKGHRAFAVDMGDGFELMTTPSAEYRHAAAAGPGTLKELLVQLLCYGNSCDPPKLAPWPPMLRPERREGAWWLVGGPNPEGPEYGPYATKAEAEEDRVGLHQFFEANPELYGVIA